MTRCIAFFKAANRPRFLKEVTHVGRAESKEYLSAHDTENIKHITQKGEKRRKRGWRDFRHHVSVTFLHERVSANAKPN